MVEISSRKEKLLFYPERVLWCCLLQVCVTHGEDHRNDKLESCHSLNIIEWGWSDTQNTGADVGVCGEDVNLNCERTTGLLIQLTCKWCRCSCSSSFKCCKSTLLYEKLCY